MVHHGGAARAPRWGQGSGRPLAQTGMHVGRMWSKDVGCITILTAEFATADPFIHAYGWPRPWLPALRARLPSLITVHAWLAARVGCCLAARLFAAGFTHSCCCFAVELLLTVGTACCCAAARLPAILLLRPGWGRKAEPSGLPPSRPAAPMPHTCCWCRHCSISTGCRSGPLQRSRLLLLPVSRAGCGSAGWAVGAQAGAPVHKGAAAGRNKALVLQGRGSREGGFLPV